jgi:hypothetical protein
MQQRRKKGAVQASADLAAAVPVAKHARNKWVSTLRGSSHPEKKELVWIHPG